MQLDKNHKHQEGYNSTKQNHYSSSRKVILSAQQLSFQNIQEIMKYMLLVNQYGSTTYFLISKEKL
jgi:hypothetical protein